MTVDRHLARGITRRRVAGVGLLGAAAAMASGTTQAGAITPAHPATGLTPASPGNGGASTRVVPAGVTPNYGFQKIRVGVQIKTGAYIPPDTTTAGTEITVTETGPNAADATEAGPCTTDAATAPPGGSETDCVFTAFGESDYTAYPGDTVTVTQKTVNPGLAIDSHSIVIPPCTSTGTVCDGDPVPAVLTDPGVPPTAAPDATHVRQGSSVVVDVLGNDDPAGAPAAVTIKTAPANGSATIIDTATSTPKIQYRPKRGFHGTDSFIYTLHTANGSANAKVTVNVSRLPGPSLRRPTAKRDHAKTSEDNAVRIHVLHNDHRNGSGALHIVTARHPHHGTVIVHKHSIGYVPAPGFYGHDHFSYKIRNRGGVDTATVKVTVTDHDGDFDGD